jgi:shikimate kinase
VIGELAAIGYKAIDVDTPAWSEYGPDGDWIWREDRIRALLSDEDRDVLFIAGCATNQATFHPQLDHIILLSARNDILIRRLMTRTNNPYGKTAAQLAEVLGYVETVEPLLRKAATHEVDTDMPLEHVVETVLRLALRPAHRQGVESPHVGACGPPLSPVGI